MLRNQHKLLCDVGKIGRPLGRVFHITFGIFGIEGLRHIKAVQPHLLRIDLFMPETALFCAGLAAELAVKGVHSPAVFLLAGEIIQGEKGPAGADMVQRIVALLVFVNVPAIVYNGIIPAVYITHKRVVHIHKPIVGGLDMIHVQYCGKLQAGGVIPL